MADLGRENSLGATRAAIKAPTPPPPLRKRGWLLRLMSLHLFAYCDKLRGEFGGVACAPAG
jgi:hypothetical protein